MPYPPTDETMRRPHPLHHPVAISVLLLCIALLPRIFGLGHGLTTDEASFWQDRSARFLAALTEGRFEETMITGHPGVTTMWLGSAGLLLERTLHDAGLLPTAAHEWQVTKTTTSNLHAVGIQRLPPFGWHLSLMRLPLACASALAVVAGSLLLRRLAGDTVALIAALLWATDPFLVAFSRLLHVDALLTMLMLLALLALLNAFFDAQGFTPRPRLPMLLAAGVATGLAQLTKSSAVLLLPVGALVMVVWAGQRWRTSDTAPRSTPADLLRMLLLAGMVWGGAALITVVVAWPAMWVAPHEAAALVINEVIDNGGQPQKGSFLLGQGYIYETPGPLYYPVTLLGRTTPWSAAGLGALLVAWFAGWPWLGGRRSVLLLLAGSVLLLLLALTLLPKKFDRYALPAMPLLHVLAAAGLTWLGGALARRWRLLATGAVAAAAILTLLAYHPYYLAYYSPLIGGSALAPRLVPIGWGEGLDVAADWLNERPDIEQGAVATWSTVSLQPYLHTTTAWQGSARKGNVNYLIVYINQVQSGKDNHYFNDIHGVCEPLHTVRLKGIEYAWIYRMPLYRQVLDGAQLAGVLEIDDIVMLPPDTCTCAPLTLTLVFNPLQQPAAPTFFFLHIVGEDGQKVAQRDMPLESVIPAKSWQSDAPFPYTLQVDMPPDVPPGMYDVVLGFYDPATSERIPATGSVAAGVEAEDVGAAYGPNTLHVAAFEVLEQYQEQCLR